MLRRRWRSHRGQTMVEMALVFPLFLIVFMGTIVIGIGVFYQQQVTNAAREAARYAAIHSATAQCPTVAGVGIDPLIDPTSGTGRYYRCDAPELLDANGNPDPWGVGMTPAARNKIFGLPKSAVQVTACWSGWVDDGSGSRDAPPNGTVPGQLTHWEACQIDGQYPDDTPELIGCDAGLYSRTTDTASNLSEGQGRIVANRVTAYTCYVWSPPMAGFLLIPETVILRGVITEPIQRQQ
jgi:hypothetical protein